MRCSAFALLVAAGPASATSTFTPTDSTTATPTITSTPSITLTSTITPTAPATPFSLLAVVGLPVVSSTAQPAVDLSWTGPGGPYRVKRSFQQGSGYVVIATVVSGNTHRDVPVGTWTPLYYRIEAFNPVATLTVVAVSNEAGGSPPMNPPSGLRADAATPAASSTGVPAVVLQWTPSTGNMVAVAGYEVRRQKLVGSTTPTLGWTPVATTTALIHTDAPNAWGRYRYRVVARDASQQLESAPAGFVQVPLLPPAPVWLRARPGSSGCTGSHVVDLEWSAVPGTAPAGYLIERSVNFGAFGTIGSSASTTLTDTSAPAGAVCTYRVRAFEDSGGGGPYSPLATAVPPVNPPGPIGAGVVKDPHIALSWDISVGPLTPTPDAYAILRSVYIPPGAGTPVLSPSPVPIPLATVVRPGYLDTDVQLGQIHHYRIVPIIAAATFPPLALTREPVIRTDADVELQYAPSDSNRNAVYHQIVRIPYTPVPSTTPLPGAPVAVGTAVGGYFLDTSAPPGGMYSYEVRAVESACPSSQSVAIGSAAVVVPPHVPQLILAQPIALNLSATPTPAVQIYWTWPYDRNAEQMTEFRLYRWNGPVPAGTAVVFPVVAPPTAVAGYLDLTVAWKQPYVYRASAWSPAYGESALSPGFVGANPYQQLVPPRGFRVSNSNHRVDMDWDKPPAPNPSTMFPNKGFRIYRARTDGPPSPTDFSLIAGEPLPSLNTSSYSDSGTGQPGLENCRRHWYKIVALDAGDPSIGQAPSESAAAGPSPAIPSRPPDPGNGGLLAARGQTNTSVTLAWNAAIPHASVTATPGATPEYRCDEGYPVAGYAIYRQILGKTPSGFALLAMVTPTVQPGETPEIRYEDTSMPSDWIRLEYIVKVVDFNPVHPNEVAYQPVLVSRIGTFMDVTRNVFNPGRGESVEFIVQVSEPSKVTLRVYTLSGEPVRRLLDGSPLSPSDSSFVRDGVAYAGIPIAWNGTNDAGKLAGPGVYLVSFDCRAASGKVTRSLKKIALAR